MNSTSFRAPLLVAAALLGLTGPALAQATSLSAEKGRLAYVSNGCWQCHGFVGQGGVAGPKLAPDTTPLAYLDAFIRHTPGTMPPYSEKILPNEDLADMHAYLASIPKPKDYKSIPLLSQ